MVDQLADPLATGRVVVADFCPHEEESMRERMGDLRLGLDPDELLRALRDAGFEATRRLPARDRVVVARHTPLPLFLAAGTRPAVPSKRTTKKNRRSP